MRKHYIRLISFMVLATALTPVIATQSFGAGSVDTRFTRTFKFNLGTHHLGGNNQDIATAVATRADGSMVVVGNVSPGAIGVEQIDPHGSVTVHSLVSFPSPVTVEAAAVALQPDDGKVLIVGTYEDGTQTRVLVVRLNANSSQLDTSFFHDGYNLGLGGHGTALALLPDGSFYVAGYAKFSALYGYQFSIQKFASDGSWDSSWGDGGGGGYYYGFDGGGDNTDQAFALTIMPDGNPLLAGNVRIGTGIDAFGLLKLDGTSYPDPHFGNTGVPGWTVFRLGQSGPCYDDPKAVALGHHGQQNRIYVAGTHCRGQSDSQFGLAAFNDDGTPDTSFGTQGYTLASFGAASTGWSANSVSAMRIWTSDKDTSSPIDHIVLAGQAHFFSGDRLMALMRFNNDGSIDPDFGYAGSAFLDFGLNAPSGTNNDGAYALAFDRGDKNGRDLIVAGYTFSGDEGALDYNFGVARVLNGDRIFWDGFSQ